MEYKAVSCAITLLILVVEVSSSIASRKPTIVDYPHFDKTKDAEVLYKAMKGWGTNEDEIISVLTHRSLKQRLEIASEYERRFKKVLLNVLKSETRGKFRDFLVALFQKPAEFYAAEIHAAVKGIGTDEKALIDVFCCIDDISMVEVRQAYEKEYSQNMDSDVKEDVSGDFGALLDALMQVKRHPQKFQSNDSNSAVKAAKQLLKAGLENWSGTTESQIIQIFSESSYSELVEIDKEYENIVNVSLTASLENETSGYFQILLLAILHYAQNPAQHYAFQLQSAIQEAKVSKFTDFGLHRHRSLTRVLVQRSEIDLKDVEQSYTLITGNYTSLNSDVRDAVTGDYRKACLNVIDGNT
ncbi:unnamed protein product [Orchesella dallaii]|uniref:Annexin n=1 Tax=Orchesella dallaii TaxID=48710 RepID=A0ABP1RCP3_9HEXA